MCIKYLELGIGPGLGYRGVLYKIAATSFVVSLELSHSCGPKSIHWKFDES